MFGIFLLLVSCNNKIERFYFSPDINHENIHVIAGEVITNKGCRDPLSYVPSDDYSQYFDTRTIR